MHFLLDEKLQWQGAKFLWIGGLVLLGYGLVRDVYLLRTCPCDEAAKADRKKSSMLCVESFVGFSAVALGLALQYFQWSKPVEVSMGLCLVLSAVILAFGHRTRDWVLILAEVPDHHNVIPTFRLHTAEETRSLLDSVEASTQ